MAGSLTRLERAILGLLLDEPMSGYDLRALFATTPIGNFSGGPGAIYPALRRLEQRGRIRQRRRPPENPRQRTVFGLTVAGRRDVIAWLRAPLTRDDVIWDVDDQMLRLAFMPHAAGPDEIAAFLRMYARETRAYARELEAHRDALALAAVPRLALEHGIALYRTRARWARRTAAAFAAPRRRRSGDRRRDA